MKATVPKIIIKPRLIAAASRTPASTEPESPAITQGEDDLSASHSNADGMDSQAMDVDGASVADDASQLYDENGLALDTPMRRPRGRPRGRGKGSLSGTPARARGRGRGRGRGRPRGGLTIRLPKRGDDDAEAGVEADVEAEGYAETQDGEGATPNDSGAEVPFGGGKPVRAIQGKNYIIDGDEYVTEEDPKGNEKIDEWGNLLGGRRFKANTFVLPNRHPHRVYMLAIDAARTSGFRDSLYYFRRNPLAFKLNATQPEKEYLIGEGKLGSHLKTRSVTLVTARSAFKLHGSKMVIDGRWVVDDYYEEKVTAEIAERGLKPGDPVGELPDPNAPKETAATVVDAAGAGGKAERGGGGAGIYRPGGPTTIFGSSGLGPYSDGPLNAVRKSLLTRDGVSEENWMLMMAMRVAEADDEWSQLRKESLKVVQAVDDLAMGLQGGGMLPGSENESATDKGKKRKIYEEEEEEEEEENADDTRTPSVTSPRTKKRRAIAEEDSKPVGVYEPHTHIGHYRSDTQPTRCRWEQLPDSATKRRVLGGTKAGNGAWALAWVDTIMEYPKPDDPPSADALSREKLLREPAILEQPIEGR